MKKYLHPKYLPLLVPIASVLGLLLRLWTMGGGPDQDGLYAPQPFAWVLLWIITFVTVAGIFILTGGLKNPGRYFDNFPRSPIAAAGCAAAALGIMYSSLTTLVSAKDLLSVLTGVSGAVSAVCLLLTAFGRYKGKRIGFVLHAVPCLFFALRIFEHCKHWSNVTQTSVFLFQFLASVCVMLATYQMCCFDVNIGNRKSSLLWSLSGVYFSVLALPMGEEPLFYAGMILWLMTNLCSVRALKAQKAPEAAAEPTPETENPAPATEEPAEPETKEAMSYDELMSWLEKE